MLVSDEEPAAARVPGPSVHVPEPPPRALDPAERPPAAPPQDLRSQLQGFFSLPPVDTPERPSPVKPAKDPDESDDEENRKAVGCVTVAVLVIASKIVEPMIPLSDGQKYLGLGVLAVVAVLIGVWTRLHDSDLAYNDRDSDRWMARFRNWLRRLFNIPVI